MAAGSRLTKSTDVSLTFHVYLLKQTVGLGVSYRPSALVLQVKH